MASGGKPFAVGGFVEVHQHKGFLLRTLVFQPVQGHVRDDVGGIAFDLDFAFVLGDEVRIVIVALSGQDFELVKTFGIVAKVQLAKHGGLIAVLVKQLREGHLGGIERKTVVDLAVEMRVFTRQNGRPGRRTDGVGNTGIAKQHPALGNAVNIGRLDQLVRIGAKGLISMVIRHDEDDIGSGPFGA